MNRSRITGDLVSQNNIFVDIANDRVGIGSTIPGEKLSLPDSAKIALGNSADLQIFHDGTHSRINAVNTGFLAINSGADALTLSAANRIDISDDFIRLRSRDGSDVYMTGTVNAAVDLYHNGTKKFETTAYGIDVTGTTGTDGLAVSGVTTITSAAPELHFTDTNANSDYSIVVNSGQFRVRDETNSANRLAVNSDGHVDIYGRLDAIGGLFASADSTIEGDLTLTDTTADSAAGPEFKLFRNSASPADADYLGQIKFAGESDTGVERNYAKITGKILDASNGTEDGIIEFAHIKAGSQVITGRWRSDSLQLLNGTALTVAGSTTVTGNIIPNSDSATDIGSNGVRFANIYGDALYGVIQNTTHTNITRVGTLSQLAVSGSANPLNITHTSANCVNLNRGGKSITIDVNYGGSNTHSLINLSSGMDLRFKLGGTDKIIFKSAGHIEPQTDSQINLGSNSVRFANIYADTLYGDGSNLTGVTSVGGDTGVDFNDNVKIRLGTGNDIEFYHNGSHNFIDITNGQLRIRHGTDNAIKTIADGAVILYYDGGQRIQTTTGGIEISGETVASSHIKLADNARLKLGTGEDFEMWHNGGTGNTNIKQQTGDVYFYTGSDLNMLMRDGTSVDLYYANSKRFETTSAGATVTGDLSISSTTPILNLIETDASSDYRLLTAGNEFVIQNDASGSFATKFKVTTSGAAVTGELDVSGTIDMNTDTGRLKLGAGDDLSLWHDGSNSYIANTGGQLRIWAKTDGYAITCTADGSVDLYYNNARKFRTVSDGCEITSAEAGDACLALIADEGDDNADYFRLKTANSGGFYLQNYAAGSWETNIKAVGNGAVELYHDNSKKLETTSAGVKVTGACYVNDGSATGNRLSVGNGGDLKIFHTNPNSYIQDSSSALVISAARLDINNAASNENMARFYQDGSTELYYNGVKTLSTASSGIKAYGGTSSANGTIDIYPTGSAVYSILNFHNVAGNSNAQIITVSGSSIYVGSGGSGDVVLRTGNSQNKVVCKHNGSVELYYNNVKHFETVSAGLNFIGSNADQLQWQKSNNLLKFRDGTKAVFGEGDDLQIHGGEGGTGAVINSANGDLFFRHGSEEQLTLRDDAGVELYYNGNKKFETTSLGVDVNGTLVTGHGDALIVDQSNNLKFCVGEYTSTGTSTGTVSMDARTYDTNKARLHKWTSPNAGGGSYGAYSEAWYDGGAYRYFYSTSSGFEFEHHILPRTNNTYDLGTTSYRWRNIYTMDLQLSNKGGKNDVDGTWGDFTIQEGEDDLFLINRRNGKKYKFNLTEVS